MLYNMKNKFYNKGQRKSKIYFLNKKESAMEEESVVSTDQEEIQNEQVEEEQSVESQIQEYKDKYLRVYAEFENFRKRTEKEKYSMYDAGSIDVMTNFLTIIDSFERGLSAMSEEKTPFEQGMEMIFNQMMSMLTSMGLEEIEALGKTFDTDFHNAVMHVEDENAGKKEIVEVLQKGYKFKNRVIRHSMVKVAN